MEECLDGKNAGEQGVKGGARDGSAGLNKRVARLCALGVGVLGVGFGVLCGSPASAVAQFFDPTLRLRQEESRPNLVPDAGPGITIPRSTPETAPAGASKLFLDLKAVTFTGASVYSASDLQDLFSDVVGKRVSVASLFERVAAVSKLYRRDGYILTRALVPAQKIANGVFQVQIIEGFVKDVALEGDFQSIEGLVRQYTDHIAEAKPVRIADIERYLLLVNDIPGITAKGTLRAGAGEVGASQLVVTITHKPVDAQLSGDNRGTRFVGPITGMVSVGENSLAGLGERLEAVYLSSADFHQTSLQQFRYQQKIGGDGLSAQITGSTSRTRPGYTLQPLKIVGNIVRVDGQIEYPIIRSRDMNLKTTFGGEYINSSLSVLGAKFSEDMIRTVYGTVRYDYLDSFGGRTFLGAGFRYGLDSLGATRKGDTLASRFGAGSGFTVLKGDLARMQSVGSYFGDFVNVNLLVVGTGQHALDSLMVPEQFAVGGNVVGRGYDPSAVTSDSGFAATGEIQTNFRTDLSYLANVQHYVFADTAATYNRTSPNGPEKLLSYGTGLRLTFNENFSMNFEAARPQWRLTTQPKDQALPWVGFISAALRY